MSRIVSSLVIAMLVTVPFLTAAPTRAADNKASTAADAPVGTAPIWIWIPQIGVSADIEVLDIDEGSMGEPEDPWAVGWYPDLGYLPEDVKDEHLVMSGHVDWWGYGPTIFADLDELQKDDQIVIGGDDGWTYTYKVTETWVVDDQSSDKDVWRVFHATNKEKEKDILTLITCSGDFDGEEYASRLVIRAELVDTEPTVTETE